MTPEELDQITVDLKKCYTGKAFRGSLFGEELSKNRIR